MSDIEEKYSQCNREREEAVLLLRQVRLLDPSLIGGFQVMRAKIDAFLAHLNDFEGNAGKTTSVPGISEN